MSIIRAKCIEAFASIMQVDPALVTDDTSPENLEEWDSLAHVQLMLELEKVFNVTISPDQSVELEDFKSIINLIDGMVN